MIKPNAPLLLSLMTAAIVSPLQATPPLPSKAFSEAFLRHRDRLMTGRNEVTTLLNDLQPLAHSGDPTAQYFIGILTLEASPGKAIPLLRSSAKAGCPAAAGVLGVHLLQENSPEALTWIQMAANNGDANSTFLLAISYLKGRNGMKLDEPKGLALAKLARRQSYSEALSSGLDSLIKEAEKGLPIAILERSAQIFISLQNEYPKIPFFLGGQSLP